MHRPTKHTMQHTVNRSKPPFPSTKMLKKLKQRRRTYSRWRWAGCQGRAMRLLVRHLARHPARRGLNNTNSPIANCRNPPFPSTQMLKKLRQLKRTYSNERWRLPRPDDAPFGVPSGPASCLLPSIAHRQPHCKP